MKNKLCKLIDVKSIVTLILTVLFCYLAVRQFIDGQSVMTIYTTVIAFYFGTQYERKVALPNEIKDKEVVINGNQEG